MFFLWPRDRKTQRRPNVRCVVVEVVKGVFHRKDRSGSRYARFRLDGKLIKKSFGQDRGAAIAYVDQATFVTNQLTSNPRKFQRVQSLGIPYRTTSPSFAHLTNKFPI
jgi:hypothetical protein